MCRCRNPGPNIPVILSWKWKSATRFTSPVIPMARCRTGYFRGFTSQTVEPTDRSPRVKLMTVSGFGGWHDQLNRNGFIGSNRSGCLPNHSPRLTPRAQDCFRMPKWKARAGWSHARAIFIPERGHADKPRSGAVQLDRMMVAVRITQLASRLGMLAGVGPRTASAPHPFPKRAVELFPFRMIGILDELRDEFRGIRPRGRPFIVKIV